MGCRPDELLARRSEIEAANALDVADAAEAVKAGKMGAAMAKRINLQGKCGRLRGSPEPKARGVAPSPTEAVLR